MDPSGVRRGAATRVNTRARDDNLWLVVIL